MAITINSITFSKPTLAEAKAFARVDTDAHDTLLQTLIDSACQEALNVSHCVFGTATINLKRFVNEDGTKWSSIDLPYYPVTAVTEVLLDDAATVEDTDWKLKGQYLEILDTSYSDTVEATYTVGRSLPDDVKHAILQRVKFGFDFGDDLPYTHTRFFESVLYRYRDQKTYVG
jgi:hypothetical protein